MRTVVIGICFMVLATCRTESRTAERDIRHGPTSSGSAAVPHSAAATPAKTKSEAQAEHQLNAEELRRCEQLLSRFELRLAVSPSDDEMTSLVAEEMKRRKEPFPEQYRFLIGKRGQHVIVSVIDLEAACRGERPGANTYHLEKKGGRVRILYEAAEL